MTISTRWFKGMTPEDRERFRSELLASGSVLERLSEILEDDLEKSVSDASLTKNYELPSWDRFQAHKLGEQSRLRKLLELIKL